jgi:hypothetical protein
MLRATRLISPFKLVHKRHISLLIQKNPGSITVKDIENSSIVKNDENDITDERLKLIHDINHSGNQLKSELNKYLIPDFSYYFKLPQESVNLEVLHRLLEINPGRVYSSVELFNKYHPQIGQPSQEIMSMLVTKLLDGEIYEIRDLDDGEVFTPSGENVKKLMELMSKFEFELQTLTSILDKISVNPGLVSVISQLVDEKLISIEQLTTYINQEPKLNNDTYIEILRIIFQKAPETLNIKQIVDLLELTRESEESNANSPAREPNQLELDFEYEKPDKKQLCQQVYDYIEEHKIDMAETALLLRVVLVESYGIYENNLQHATDLFHKYQSHAKFGIGMVQYQLFKSYCYHAISDDKQIYLKIGETLVNPQEMNVRTIQLLMVTQSHFDSEIALKYYNDYIAQVSKEVNSTNKRSSAGYLTESLVLASLYDNDRNFATLVLEKAVENGIVTDEHEISQIKRLFKLYGDSFKESDDWELAKPFFKQHVLDYMKRL